MRISGVGDLLTQIAQCCKPLPNDPIVGYITRGRGVSIHRADCRNVLNLAGAEQARLIDVAWSGGAEESYPVEVAVEAYDRKGLLRDVTAVVSNEAVNIVALDSSTDRRTHVVQMRLTVEVRDIEQLSRVLGRLAQLPNGVRLPAAGVAAGRHRFRSCRVGLFFGRARRRPGAPGGPEWPDRKPAGRRNGETAVRTQMKLALVLAGAWLLFSGILQPLILGLGLASVLGVAWLKARRRPPRPRPGALRVARQPPSRVPALAFVGDRQVERRRGAADPLAEPARRAVGAVAAGEPAQRAHPGDLRRLHHPDPGNAVPSTSTTSGSRSTPSPRTPLDELERGEMNARACRLDREPAD